LNFLGFTLAIVVQGQRDAQVLAGGDDYVIDHSTTLSLIGPDRREAVTFAIAEPYRIAARLIEALAGAGLALGDVNNLRAYR